MASDGSVVIDTRLDSSGAIKGMKALGNSLKKIGGLVATAFSVGALVNFGKQAIELASDISEVQNVVDTAFEGMSYKMEEFADKAIEMYGISKLTAKRTGSTYMSMARGLGLSMEEASDMALTLTGLTADMASFYNVSQEVADTAIKSVFTGETESLKQYGIVMTQTNLQEFAYRQGITKKIQAMTQAEQVQLRYAYVLEQTALAQGDFAKTSDSWANQTRILSERWKEFLSIVGSGLIQVLTPALKILNQFVASLITVATNLSKMFGLSMDVATATGGAGAQAIGDIADATTDATDATKNYEDAVKASDKAMKSLQGNVDELNVITSPSKSGKDDSDKTGADIGGALSGISAGVGDAGIAMEKLNDESSGLFDNMLKKIEPLTTSFDKFKKSLDPLKTFVAKGLSDFYHDLLVPLGKWTLNNALPTLLDGLTKFNTNVNWDKLNGAFHNLWTSLEPFAENVGNGLLWFYTNVLIPLGTWTVSKVVPEFLDILSGAIDVLNKAIDDLKPIGQWLWDTIISPVAEITGNVIVDLLDGIGDGLEWIANNDVAMSVLEAFAISLGVVSTALGVYTLAQGLATAATTAFGIAVGLVTSPITLVVLGLTALGTAILLVVKNWDKIKKALNKAGDWLGNQFKKGAENVKKAWSKMGNFFAGIWVKIKKVFSNVGTWFYNKFVGAKKGVEKGFSRIGTFFGNVWSNIKKVFSNVGTWFLNKFKNAGANLKKGFSGIGTFFSNVWKNIKNVFANVGTWFYNKFKNAGTSIQKGFSGIGTFFSGIGTTISNSMSNVKKNLGIVMSNISKSWKESWTGIKNTVGSIFDGIWTKIKGVCNTILRGIESMINGVINGFNSMIKALNKLSIKIPDWVPEVGGNNLGFNLKSMKTIKIPKLASGAVLPANQPFMAMVGDQKHGTNIETPLSTMIDAFKTAMGEVGINVTFEVQGDPDKIFKIVQKQDNINYRRTGKPSFNY